ncbi:MAG: hypothetical protein K9M98_03170 [Cephaloticoccus sp.]|nr:hypothetical protein [Cephaloticoccus sp.]MCF7759483.1 hypothetical protein [Cephaloticoccus sp.]
MNLAQRIIIWLGCNALILLWLQPPVYLVNSDGSRLEQGLLYFWQLAPEWSVNVPLLTARIAIVTLVTVGFCLVFKTGTKKLEANK